MQSDEQKWNKKYSQRLSGPGAPDNFLISAKQYLLGGRALDIACGLGAASLWLARSGYKVDAVDISSTAISELRKNAETEGRSINAYTADLDTYSLPENQYDLVTVFYFYLNRIVPQIEATLKKDGLLVYATYNENQASVAPGFNPDYLVSSTDFAGSFGTLKIVVSEPLAGPRQNISRVIACKAS